VYEKVVSRQEQRKQGADEAARGAQTIIRLADNADSRRNADILSSSALADKSALAAINRALLLL